MITLYSTGCPNCNVLKAELKKANMQYVEITDVDTILDARIDKVPVLEVEGIRMSHTAAIEWIREKGRNNNEEQ